MKRLIVITLLVCLLGGCSEDDIKSSLSAAPSLDGKRELTMPAGFKQQGFIEYIGEFRYRIPLRGNLGGVYQEQGMTLKMFNPVISIPVHYARLCFDSAY